MAAARREDLNRLQLEAQAEQQATAPEADYYPDLGYFPTHRRSKGHTHHGGAPSKPRGDMPAPRAGLGPSEHR